MNLFTTFLYIRQLIANNTNIVDFDRDSLENARDLDLLDLSHNSLTYLPAMAFSKAPQLNVVILSHNYLSVLEASTFHGIFEVRRLYLDNNLIDYINIDASRILKKLSVLSLNDNLLEHFDIAHNGQVKQLYLQNNNLTSIYNKEDQPLDEFRIDGNNLTETNVLYASYLNITNTGVDQCIVSKITKILYAEYNKINIIIPFNNEHTNNFDLIEIYLAHNSLNSTPNLTHFINLELVDISYNLLQRIDANTFTYLSNLKTLNISHNHLKYVDLSFLPNTNNLQFLNIAYNQLNSFRLEFFTSSLKLIHVEGNSLTTVDTNVKQLAPALSGIGVDDNNIECQQLTSIMLLFYFDNVTLIPKEIFPDNNNDKNQTNVLSGKGFVKGIKCIEELELLPIDRPQLKVDGNIAEKQESYYNELKESFERKISEIETKLMEKVQEISTTNLNVLKKLEDKLLANK